MLLHVVHDTNYEYTPAVKTAHHVSHLRPGQHGPQQVLGHRLRIWPAPSHREESSDVFGNARCFFGIQSSHDSLQVVAESVVRTAPAWTPVDTADWETARERMRYHRAARYNAATEFLFGSPYVPRDDKFAAYARPSFQPGRGLLEAARDLCARVHADFRYEAQATDASTPALEALDLRMGVCQDFAHVMIGCLRSLGLPARYVSGYLLTEPPPGQRRLVGSDASHAWVSIYMPGPDGDGDWTDLDPTNNRAPGDDYVTLAVGRDYSDISPIRGVIHGGANHTLRVAVTVTPLSDDAAPTIADLARKG